MITVCLTHDVDRVRKTYQYVTKTLKALAKGKFGKAWYMLQQIKAKRSPYWGFDVVREIEEQHGVKSTFFFLEESAKVQWLKPKSYKIALGRYQVSEPKVAAVMRELDANGWEIGLHGSYYSYDNAELLKREKAAIESVLGHDIVGIRQHYLNWNENTWRYQEEAGFKYDSTWGFTRAIGFKEDKVKPFYPIEGSDFCEIPLTIMDSCFADAKDRWDRLEEIMAEIDKQNAVLVINFHTNNFDELEFPDYKSNYVRLIETLQERGAEFLTMREAVESGKWKAEGEEE